MIGTGYNIGLTLKAPYINGKFETMYSKTTALEFFGLRLIFTGYGGFCSSEHNIGVVGSINVGASLGIEAKGEGSDKKLIDIKLGVSVSIDYRANLSDFLLTYPRLSIKISPNCVGRFGKASSSQTEKPANSNHTAVPKKPKAQSQPAPSPLLVREDQSTVN